MLEVCHHQSMAAGSTGGSERAELFDGGGKEGGGGERKGGKRATHVVN